MSTNRGVIKSPVASEIPTDSDLTVQEELDQVSSSASPGFSFGRASNVNSGTWLQCETVPSNKAGRFVYISSPTIERLFVSSENVSTFDISIYHHEGDEVNLTLVGTYSVVSARGATFTVDESIPTSKQLALKLSSGSARNVVAGLELSGTDT